jgi:hypothetical protein
MFNPLEMLHDLAINLTIHIYMFHINHMRLFFRSTYAIDIIKIVTRVDMQSQEVSQGPHTCRWIYKEKWTYLNS